MKKKLTILMMAIALIAGSFCMDAKTTRKSSSKKATPAATVTGKFQDGYPNVTGHTYTKTEEGVKMVVSFKNGNEATLTLSQGKVSESYDVYWEYLGDGFVFLNSPDGTQEIVMFISDSGKSLYLVDDYGDVMWNYGPMKLVK